MFYIKSIFLYLKNLFNSKIRIRRLFVPNRDSYKYEQINKEYNEYKIAIYFSGKKNHIYQVEQWLNIFEELNKYYKIVFVVRKKNVFKYFIEYNKFPAIYCNSINDLVNTYDENNFKVILYVNHGLQNFQSLMYNRALHIHINHGESEKTSTISNQAKAYDYVFIVGDAAYDKYKLNLIKKDMSKFVKIGRPQLDFIERVNLPLPKDKKIILYAPTWEGTHDSMNFTSLNDFGMSIVQQILDAQDYFLIYKPHPNTGSRDERTKSINSAIIKLIDSHKDGLVILDGDINSIYEHVDLAIFDNSAVAIDYLQCDKPMLITEALLKIRDIQHEPKLKNAGKIIFSSDIKEINNIIFKEILNDSYRDARNSIKKYYLGDFNYQDKESSNYFIQKIIDAVKLQTKLEKKL